MNDTHKQAAAFLEKQLETEAPNLDADLRRSLASMGAHLAEGKAEKAKAMQGKAAAKAELANVLQLPLWSEATRGTPNSFLRGALFAAPCVRIDVASLKETLLACRGRNEENDDSLSKRIQSQDHCTDAAAA